MSQNPPGNSRPQPDPAVERKADRVHPQAVRKGAQGSSGQKSKHDR